MAAFIAAITSVVGWPRRHESAGMPTRAGCLHPRGGDPATPRARVRGDTIGAFGEAWVRSGHRTGKGAGMTETGGLAAGVGGPVTDTELASRLHRDPELFTVVYDRYIRDIYRYVAGRLDTQVADDIAAETFLVAFCQRDRFDPGRGSLRPWLYGIATNLVARHRRKEARHYRALARAAAEPAADGPESRVLAAVAAQRLQPQLARALTLLTPGERDVLLLVALSQLSHEEVAEALGITYSTVASRLSRARHHDHPRRVDEPAAQGHPAAVQVRLRKLTGLPIFVIRSDVGAWVGEIRTDHGCGLPVDLVDACSSRGRTGDGRRAEGDEHALPVAVGGRAGHGRPGPWEP